MPRLDFYVNYELQSSIRLDGSEVKIGRDPACTVQLADARVSRVHAVITREADGYAIENLSPNGTRVNGRELTAREVLHPADSIFISRYILIYQDDGVEPAQLASTALG